MIDTRVFEMKKNKKSTQSESLFNTGAYSSEAVGDFNNVKYDPGWDTGAAFPEVHKKISAEEEVIKSTLNLEKVSPRKIENNSQSLNYISSEVSEQSVLNSTVSIQKVSLKKIESDNEGWDSRYFNSDPPRSIDSLGQLSIFFDDHQSDALLNNSFLRETNSTNELLIDSFLVKETNVLRDNSFLGETEDLQDEGDKKETVLAPKRHRKGSLYPYIEEKKLKDGTIASYPRVTGARDRDNIRHWRWGYCWEEKVNGQWKNRSISVPIATVSLIIGMQNNRSHVDEIISFIKNSKVKKEKKEKDKVKSDKKGKSKGKKSNS